MCVCVSVTIPQGDTATDTLSMSLYGQSTFDQPLHDHNRYKGTAHAHVREGVDD